MFQVLALFVAVACFVGGQQAIAQGPHHLQARIVAGPHSNVSEAKKLEQLSAGFGFLPPVDGSGNDEWPCFPNQNANGADCSSIATGGVVIGTPAYTQSLADCDNSGSTYSSCGQLFWFYEDDTGNNTDDLVISVVVKQGAKYILDTGSYSFGPNPFPAGSVVVISDDTSFGTVGQTGPGNGNCAGSTETCVNPVKGAATVTITTTVGTSTIKATFNMFLE
jgi:hypothetical protein